MLDAHPCTVENDSPLLWGCLTYPLVLQISLSNTSVIQSVVCYHNKHPNVYIIHLIILVYNQHIFVLTDDYRLLYCFSVSCVWMYMLGCFPLIFWIKSQMVFLHTFLFCVKSTSPYVPNLIQSMIYISAPFLSLFGCDLELVLLEPFSLIFMSMFLFLSLGLLNIFVIEIYSS